LQPRWRPLPGNVIALEAASPPLEQTVKLRIKERDGEWRDWKLAQDLAFQGPADRIFLVDREKGVIHFGDGLTGRLPVTPQEVEVRYQAGGGRIGNLGANLSWEGRMDDTLTATNVVQADGGAESETMEAARQRVASTIKHRYRAVTREDYEEIARGLTDVRTGVTPGVAIKRAHAALGFHPGHPCSLVPGAVTVFIVPDAPREKPGEDMDEDFVESAFVAAPTPDPGALDAVRARLERARLVTAEVFVLPPRYVKTSLRVTVESDSPEPIKLREQITERLQEFLDPLIGGDDRLGWPFGEPLRPSVLLREAQRAMDDAGEAVAVAIKLVDNDAPEEDCEEVRIGENDLIELVEVNVSFQRAAAIRGAGGLR
jgi:predicted phage baseplate assembly protein